MVFFTRRQILWPTLAGWLLIFILFLVPATLWIFRGEDFLSCTDNPYRPERVLVLEGWIGSQGAKAAKAEFEQGKYSYIVTTGGESDYRWGQTKWSYAQIAHDLLLRLGLPPEKVINAPAHQAERQRTYYSAVAVRLALQERKITTPVVIVFTEGPHARRSRLVFSKVFGSDAHVGVISWQAADFDPGPWWHSSERSLEFFKETIGWLFELLLNSGRTSNHELPPETEGKSRSPSDQTHAATPAPDGARSLLAALASPVPGENWPSLFSFRCHRFAGVIRGQRGCPATACSPLSS